MEEKVEQPLVENCGAQQEQSSGSIGKFKDATSLLNAYNSLQAEFTRKSQELAEMKKHMDELAQKDEALTNENLDNISENNSHENGKNIAQNQDFDAILSQKLLNFAENNPDKLNDINNIKAEILSNRELINLDNGLDIAYRLCEEKQKSKPAELINNPEFIDEYILPNKDITDKIIDKYIKSLADSKSPKIIQGDIGYAPISPNENLPKTLGDANKIFQKMLEK